MSKFNKNQTKFFEEAIKYFGEGSKDVRYKDLVDFAAKNDLIVPVSALKLFCQREELVRGHYDLTLSGIVVENVKPTPQRSFVNTDDDDEDGNSVIIESSVFAAGSSNQKVDPKLPKTFYVVLDDDLIPTSLHKTINGAYIECATALGKKSMSSLEKAQKDIRANKCHCVISEENPKQYFIHELELKN